VEFDRMRGDWAAQRQQVRQQWSKLTDEDLEAIDGDRNALLNVLEQRYDSPRDELEQQVSNFEDRIGADAETRQTAGRNGDARPGSQGGQQYEEDSVAKSRNTPVEEQTGAGSMGNKRAPEQNAGGKLSIDKRRHAEQADGAGKSDKRSVEQADGSSKTDRQQQGGQKGKQPSVPPSWQRQAERRPEHPNR